MFRRLITCLYTHRALMNDLVILLLFGVGFLFRSKSFRSVTCCLREQKVVPIEKSQLIS